MWARKKGTQKERKNRNTIQSTDERERVHKKHGKNRVSPFNTKIETIPYIKNDYILYSENMLHKYAKLH